MQPNGDASAAKQRLTVSQAANALGITSEAVRSRVRRGTLASERTEDGTLYVLVEATKSDATDDRSHDQAMTIERLDSEVRFLREELIRREETFREREETFRQLEEAWQEESRRKDHIIMSLAQRIPELEPVREPTSDARESSVTASENEPKGQVSSEQEEAHSRPSFWQRLFGR